MATTAAGASAPGPAAVPRTLVEHFRGQVTARPDAPALYFRAGGRWQSVTWGQFGAAARRIAAFLVAEEVPEAGFVGIWSANRPEWHIADMAVLTVRARPVPVYLTVSAEQAAHVLGHSEAQVVFVETADLAARLLSVRDHLPALRRIVVIDGAVPDELAVTWEEALARGEAALNRGAAADVDRRAASVTLDDVATLIYTSGTTGLPKAVILTHRNIAAALAAGAAIVGGGPDDRQLSYLPLAHIAERLISEFRQYVFGNPVHFVGGVEQLPTALAEVRPTLFFAVPRIWEKMVEGVKTALQNEPAFRGAFGRFCFSLGAQAAARRERGVKPTRLQALEHRMADRLVLAGIRRRLGLDQVRVAGTGAAPIAIDLLRFLAAVGIEVCEVYGQTENAGVTSINPPGRVRVGTVGLPYPGVDVRIADDGEILMRGDVVFTGYYRDPEATAATLVDGWLLTGDVGRLDADGYLTITDRKKDIIITAGGKNIAPGTIEALLKNHRLVGNAVVIGDARPYVTALLTLDEAEAVAWARERRLTATPAQLAADERVQELLQQHIDAVNERLSNVERIKRWSLLPRDFAVGEELTPTLKVRRRAVTERYAAEIRELYPGSR